MSEGGSIQQETRKVCPMMSCRCVDSLGAPVKVFCLKDECALFMSGENIKKIMLLAFSANDISEEEIEEFMKSDLPQAKVFNTMFEIIKGGACTLGKQVGQDK